MKSFHLHLVSDCDRRDLESRDRTRLSRAVRGGRADRAYLVDDTHGASGPEGRGGRRGQSRRGAVHARRARSIAKPARSTACRRAFQVPCIAVLDPTMLNAFGELSACSRRGHQAGPAARSSMPTTSARIDGDGFRDDRMTTVRPRMGDIDEGRRDPGRRVAFTSKTPTCIYLANRGIKAANVPSFPVWRCLTRSRNCTPRQNGPMFVGLTNDPNLLVQLRRNRLNMLNESRETDYTDLDKVRSEVTEARASSPRAAGRSSTWRAARSRKPPPRS